MQKKLSDFQSALLHAVLEDYADIPEEAEINIALSPQLQSKAKELIHHPGRYSHRLTIRRVLIIAAILSILATTALAIPSVREAIVDFFLVEHSGSYGITFDPAEAETAPREIVEVYGPTDVPDGYELVIEDVSAAGVAFWYANEEDQWICFTQYVLPPDATDDSWFGVNAEETSRRSMLLGEFLVEEIQSRSAYFWFWTDNSYLYSLEISNEIPVETTEEVYRSLKALYPLSEEDCIN